MVFSVCYNANTKIRQTEHNAKFILFRALLWHNIFDKAKDRENIPTAQQRKELFSVTILHRIELANGFTSLSVVGSRQSRVYKLDPPPHPRLGGGFRRNPQRYTALDYRWCKFVSNHLVFTSGFSDRQTHAIRRNRLSQNVAKMANNRTEATILRQIE